MVLGSADHCAITPFRSSLFQLLLRALKDPPTYRKTLEMSSLNAGGSFRARHLIAPLGNGAVSLTRGDRYGLDESRIRRRLFNIPSNGKLALEHHPLRLLGLENLHGLDPNRPSGGTDADGEDKHGGRRQAGPYNFLIRAPL